MKNVICGQAGYVFTETVKLNGTPQNLSSPDTLSIRIYRPDNTTVDQTAVLFTDGTDGIVKYTLVATDTAPSGTAVPGPYRFRFRVVKASLGLDAWLDDRHFWAEALS